VHARPEPPADDPASRDPTAFTWGIRARRNSGDRALLAETTSQTRVTFWPPLADTQGSVRRQA
jgi:hypothetical protein